MKVKINQEIEKIATKYKVLVNLLNKKCLACHNRSKEVDTEEIKQIFVRRAFGVVPPKFEAVITDLGTSEKKKSFFKRLWQKLKRLFKRSKLCLRKKQQKE